MTSAIVIVNWNSWQDTARCISACAKLQGFSGVVFVIDNGSTDSSFESLSKWLNRSLNVEPTGSCAEIAALELMSNESFFRVVSGDVSSVSEFIHSEGVNTRSLYLIRSDENRGFGAGNNIGIRLAMLDASVDLFWCLNADAVPLPNALKVLETHCLGRVTPLLAGSVLLDYTPERKVQAVGSDFSKLTLKVGYKHAGEPIEALDGLPSVYSVDYPIGAALVMNRAFIERYGMFDERYFLYFEEPDLAARLRGTSPFICTDSLVYHKGGQTTGGGTSVQNRGAFADYHYNRSRALLAKKMGLGSVLMAFFASTYSVMRRLQAGRLDLAKRVLPAFFDGLKAH